jgi:tetratricopeptide (TPR) repeat protein
MRTFVFTTRCLSILLALLIAATALAAPTASTPEHRWRRDMELGRLAFYEARYTASEGYYRSALAEAARLTELHTAQTLGDLGVVVRTAYRYAEAEKLLQRAVEIYVRHAAQYPGDLFVASANLAETYRMQGKIGPAEAILQASQTAVENRFGRNHPIVANFLNVQGSLHQQKGDLCGAEGSFKDALVILGENPDYAASRATVLSNLALLYLGERKIKAAEENMELALQLFRKALGEDHPEIATAYGNLGAIRLAQGRLNEAAGLFTRCLQMRELHFGKNHPEVANALINLANLDAKRGNSALARLQLMRALKIRSLSFGFDSPMVADVLIHMAILETSAEKYTEAERLVRKAELIQQKRLQPQDPTMGRTFHVYGTLFVAQHRVNEAIASFSRAVAVLERFPGLTRLAAAESLESLATCFSIQGDHAQAERAYRRALEYKTPVLGQFNAELVRTLKGLAGELRHQGHPDDAVPYEDRATQIIQSQNLSR